MVDFGFQDLKAIGQQDVVTAVLLAFRFLSALSSRALVVVGRSHSDPLPYLTFSCSSFPLFVRPTRTIVKDIVATVG